MKTKKLTQKQLDEHNAVMLTCIDTALRARNENPNDPKAQLFFYATINWFGIHTTQTGGKLKIGKKKPLREEKSQGF